MFCSTSFCSIALESELDPGLCGFIKEEGNPFWKVTWDHWANKCLIATADSIEKFTLERTRQPIVALAYFFTQHERHLLAKHHDEEDAKRAMLDTCVMSATWPKRSRSAHKSLDNSCYVHRSDVEVYKQSFNRYGSHLTISQKDALNFIRK